MEHAFYKVVECESKVIAAMMWYLFRAKKEEIIKTSDTKHQQTVQLHQAEEKKKKMKTVKQ